MISFINPLWFLSLFRYTNIQCTVSPHKLFAVLVRLCNLVRFTISTGETVVQVKHAISLGDTVQYKWGLPSIWVMYTVSTGGAVQNGWEIPHQYRWGTSYWIASPAPLWLTNLYWWCISPIHMLLPVLMVCFTCTAQLPPWKWNASYVCTASPVKMAYLICILGSLSFCTIWYEAFFWILLKFV